MVFHIELITLGLGPTTVELALPLNATEGPKLSFATVIGDQVVLKVGIQLPHSPLLITLGRYAQLLLKVLADPCCQFGRQPAKNQVGFAIRIFESCLHRLYIVCANDILLSWKDIHAGRLEKMHVQALLASEVMVCIADCCASVGFSALHLCIIYDIIYDIMNKYMISCVIFT